jgi:two-component system, probable response regulator PhcQ
MSADRSVLVVDDIPEILGVFEGVVRRIADLDVELVTEVDSQRAKERLAKQEFDLVVSDFRMREIDGIEVLVAASLLQPTGARILMSGYEQVPADLDRIRGAGIDAYLRKPLGVHEVQDALLAFLRPIPPAVEAYRARAREIERAALEAHAGGGVSLV